MEKEFEFKKTEEDSSEKVELQNGIRANIIEASWDVLDSISQSDVDVHRIEKEDAELFYTKGIISLLPEGVDGLCLYPGKKFIREEAREDNSEDIYIWGPKDLKKYIKKLKKKRKGSS